MATRRRKTATRRRRRSNGNGRRGIGRRITESLKSGFVDAAILYPMSKVIWGVDQMAKNFLPVGFPAAARTPAVTLTLSMLPSAVVDARLADKIGSLTMAAGLVQTLQGFTTMDNALNAGAAKIAQVGMAGYTTRMNGYVQKMGGYVRSSDMGANNRPSLRGYTHREF